MSAAPNPFAFVIMPFDPSSNEVYELAVRPACERAGVSFERMDERLCEQATDGTALEQAKGKIAAASVVIADMTGRDPLLFFVTGYAYTLKRRIILITRSKDDPPPDLRDRHPLVYGSGLGRLRVNLEARLRKHSRPRALEERVERSAVFSEADERARSRFSEGGDDDRAPGGNARLIIREPEKVFVSYSHRDKRWLEMLQTMSAPLVWGRKMVLWDDRKIKPGARWEEAIYSAILQSRVAVLLVSANFLASEFVVKQELPLILEAGQRYGLTILWFAVSLSFYEMTEIADYQALNNPSKPLDSLSPAKRNEALFSICEKISDALRSTPGGR